MLTTAQKLLGIHLREFGLEPSFEYQVCPDRRWRWDICLEEQHILIDLDGWFKGRHGAGWGSDFEKQNWATLNGWRCLRFANKDVLNGRAKAWLAVYLADKGE